MNEETVESNGCLPKVVSSWRHVVSSLNFGHQVYPLDPIAPKDSEFIVIDGKFNIRVIHIKPEDLRKSVIYESFRKNGGSKRNSLAEEYWFSKWNKPLKIGNCNCSFRRSMRYSIISNKQTSENSRESNINLDKPTKIVNVETFVDRLIQETFFESFQEYYMSINNKPGKINYAYEITEEENLVTLRNKSEPKITNKCVHKKSQKKPLIFLLHGIGATADVWLILINTLISKGFEIIAPDLLGHGFSSAPNKESLYSFENLLLQFLTIFDHYMNGDDKKKAIIIAHSYGCSLATALYQHRNSQISQLILISGGGPTPLAAPVNENEISPFGCVYTLFKPLFFCGLKRSFFYASRGKHFKPCDPDCGIPPHILQYLANGQRWAQGDAAFHRRILVPTLLVHGLQDQNVTLVQQCEMERTIPRAFLELIPNAGHMSMLETPEHLTHMIVCFLDWWT